MTCNKMSMINATRFHCTLTFKKYGEILIRSASPSPRRGRKCWLGVRQPQEAVGKAQPPSPDSEMFAIEIGAL